MAVHRTGDDFIFKVESDTNYSTTYLVEVTPDQPATCTCTAFAIRRNKDKNQSIMSKVPNRPDQFGVCKHIRAVLTGEEMTGKEGVARQLRHQLADLLED